MLEKITHHIICIAVIMSVFAGMAYLFQKQGAKMHQYSIEHNCRWDYNDMCYTKEQRPWLFK